MNITENNEATLDIGRLGKLPARSSQKALLFDDFLKPRAEVKVPESFDFWGRRKPFPLRSFGNREHGCCTVASQALAAMRSERLEQRRTIEIPTESVLKAYYDMTARLYGGGDTGAYETDALSQWRNPDLTFRDGKGRPVTIDAFTRINHFDHEAVRRAFFITAGKGIKVCFNLPVAWSYKAWDLPEGQSMTGEWMPGSWGGHSMFAVSKYNKNGFWVVHSWDIPDQFVTWRGAAAYMDEAHWYIDSINSWKKTKASSSVNFSKLVSAVNEVSSIKIK
jgi:hypothetical protein